VGNTTIAKVVKPLIPIFIAMSIGLLLITYVPGLSTWLPGVFGL
jgi:TRAP-type C4-dicarboxylate transport system permease large subunit